MSLNHINACLSHTEIHAQTHVPHSPMAKGPNDSTEGGVLPCGAIMGSGRGQRLQAQDLGSCLVAASRGRWGPSASSTPVSLICLISGLNQVVCRLLLPNSIFILYYKKLEFHNFVSVRLLLIKRFQGTRERRRFIS